MKFNGNIVLNVDASAEIQNAYVERVAADPTGQGSQNAGRLIYNTTGKVYKYHDGVSWVAIATGGNAAALQTEVDAIETSLGGAIAADGTFVAAGFTGDAFSTAPTSFTDAINKVAAYAVGHDTLAEMSDVTLTATTAGDYLKYNGTKWVNDALTLSDVTDVTATAAEVNQLSGATVSAADLNKLHAVTASAAELNILDGATLDVTELNYVDGVTSPIQTQLDDKQQVDATLTALAALSGTGILVETGVDTFAHRSLTAPSAGITISNADGVSGSPTFALANDLAALEGLSTFGYIVRDADGSAKTVSLSVNAGQLVITGDASGVSTDTTIGLATVTDSGTGSFKKLATDSFGRVTGTTNVVLADIKALADSEYVNVAGDTMTGSLVLATGNHITLPDAPVNASDAANKGYVDALVTGLSWKNAVRVIATTEVNVTGPSSATIDGITLANGDRVLLKGENSSLNNGIWVFNGVSAAMTRPADADTAAELQAAAVFVKEGTYANTGWLQSNPAINIDGSVQVTPENTQSWVEFSGGATYVGGVGLDITGNVISVNLGAGIAQLPSDEVGIDVASGLALQLTGTATADKLTFVLDGGAASGMEQSSAGLKISAGGVTNAMLAHPQFTINGDAGTDSLVLGDTLQIKGTSVQGISTTVSESPVGTSTFTLTIADASSSQKGVATFNTGDFDVTAGDVTIKAAGVDNAQLAFSTIAFAGSDASSDTVALGETVSFIDGGSHSTAGSLVLSSVAANGVTLKVREATASLLGVASFDANHFSVTAGAVSLVASIDDLSNVDGADSAVTGDLLTYDGTNWTKATRATVFGSQSIDALSDVDTTTVTPAAGQTLVFNGTAWVNKKTFHVYSGASATTHTVTHDIGAKYCNVTVVETATDEVIIPQSIVFTSATQLVVTFNSAVAATIIVAGIA